MTNQNVGPRDVLCVTCDAEPGAPCRYRGRPIKKYHDARSELAEAETVVAVEAAAAERKAAYDRHTQFLLRKLLNTDLRPRRVQMTGRRYA